MIGTGGLSHQLGGERPGFINMDFDLAFMESLSTNTKVCQGDMPERHNC